VPAKSKNAVEAYLQEDPVATFVEQVKAALLTSGPPNPSYIQVHQLTNKINFWGILQAAPIFFSWSSSLKANLL